MKNSFLVLLLLFGLSFRVFPQEAAKMQESYLEAEYFLMNGDYQDALSIYLQLLNGLPENANLSYKTGICYLNIPGKKNLSVSYLETAVTNVSPRYKVGSVIQDYAPYDAIFQLGVAYRINFRFDAAIEAFRKYRKTLLPDDSENISFIDHEIKVCNDAKKMVAVPVEFTLINMGENINNGRANFNPVISADGKTFAYMTAERFYDGVMVSKMVNGSWSEPVNIYSDLQIDGGIFISGLSAEGKTLYLSRDDNDNSDLFLSTFDGKRWSPNKPFGPAINTKNWESHPFVSEDGQTLVFASDRPGGYGGLDIYFSRLKDGVWTAPVNAGPDINTRFNEDRPFILDNGRIMFFSSQSHSSMGGYDVFRSEKQSNGLWSVPVNPGYPFNTPDDNIFFMPVGDGKTGYFSRTVDGEGFGSDDIYKVIFK
jgi:hypothetical protein